MEFVTGGGWMALVGMVPLLMGLVGCYRAFAGEPQGWSSDSMLAGLAELAGSLLFAGLGVVLAFGRHGYIFDRREWQVTIWWGLLRPWLTRTRPLAEFDRVTLDRRMVRNGKTTQELFPVELQGSGAPLRLVQPPDYEPARRRAEAMAEFLELELYDSTSGAVSVREPGRLNESLREQALTSGETVEWPELPEGSRIDYRTEGEQAIVVLPPTRIAAAKRAVCIALVLVGVDLALFALLPILVPGIPTVVSALGLVLSLMGAFAVAAILFFKPGRLAEGEGERIVISARELRCQGGVFSGSAPAAIASDELEELHLEPSIEHPLASVLGLTGGLVARSDRQTLRFGMGLSLAERQWLRDVIRYIVVGEPADADEFPLPTQSAR